MAFVLDASVAACWALSDEDHPAAEVAFRRIRHTEAITPTLWWFEIRNILIVSERRKRITQSESSDFLREISQLPIRVDHDVDEADVMRLARSHRLSIYDAAYLELARRNRAPLATLDADLARAAKAEAVTLIEDTRDQA